LGDVEVGGKKRNVVQSKVCLIHNLKNIVGLEAYRHLFLTFTLDEGLVSFTPGPTSPPGQNQSSPIEEVTEWVAETEWMVCSRNNPLSGATSRYTVLLLCLQQLLVRLIALFPAGKRSGREVN
jgi:hypothetical protein